LWPCFHNIINIGGKDCEFESFVAKQNHDNNMRITFLYSKTQQNFLRNKPGTTFVYQHKLEKTNVKARNGSKITIETAMPQSDAKYSSQHVVTDV